MEGLLLVPRPNVAGAHHLNVTGDSTTERRLGYKAEQSLASSVDYYSPWMKHKSVDPTFDYNVEMFVANNILQVSFLRYELHCVFNPCPANVKNTLSS